LIDWNTKSIIFWLNFLRKFCLFKKSLAYLSFDNLIPISDLSIPWVFTFKNPLLQSHIAIISLLVYIWTLWIKSLTIFYLKFYFIDFARRLVKIINDSVDLYTIPPEYISSLTFLKIPKPKLWPLTTYTIYRSNWKIEQNYSLEPSTYSLLWSKKYLKISLVKT